VIGRFEVVPLAAAHDRTLFDSGSQPPDRYLRHQVTQDIRRRVTACFVALAPISTGEQRIAAYYTLASASLLLADLPPATAKKLPRYPSVPAVRMGRLAVDEGAAAFYRHHAFIGMPDSPLTLFLPLATARRLMHT